MPTIFTHAVAATAVSSVTKPDKLLDKWWATAAVLSMFPDTDVIGFRVGIHYGDLLGHRGLTHSILFAAIASTVALRFFKTDETPSILFRSWMILFLATVSHGVLDAMTSGGLGVAFFSPFSNERYFFPWRPIRVSPIGIERFFSARAWPVLKSEFVWIWLPSLIVVAATLFIRKPKVAR